MTRWTAAHPELGLRILVVVPGTIGANMAGPEIRGWELSRALARHARVTVLCDVPRQVEHDGIVVAPFSRRRLLKIAHDQDAVIAPWHQPFLFAWLSRSCTVLVSDLYDPSELELVHKHNSPGLQHEIAAVVRLTRVQERFADVLLSGGRRQADALTADLRRRPHIGPRPRLEIVPFGLPPAPAGNAPGRLRGALHGVGPSDPLILWWGSIWRWLDPDTAIRAVQILSERRPNVRLVFTSGRPGRSDGAELTDTEAARRLAAELGLLGTTVHFFDEWVPYESRAEVLGDADVAITLHRDPAEARLAARARYLDYLWCGVPCVLGEGDEMAADLAAAGVARTVPTGDPVAVAHALDAMLDPGCAAAAREAAGTLAAGRSWDSVAAPVLTAIEDVILTGAPRHRRPAATGIAAISYYGRAGIDALRARARRRSATS